MDKEQLREAMKEYYYKKTEKGFDSIKEAFMKETGCSKQEAWEAWMYWHNKTGKELHDLIVEKHGLKEGVIYPDDFIGEDLMLLESKRMTSFFMLDKTGVEQVD